MSRKNHRRETDFIPYDKMSKRDKKQIDKEKRGNWGGIDPRTRREDKDKYKRRKQKQKEKDDYYYYDEDYDY